MSHVKGCFVAGVAVNKTSTPERVFKLRGADRWALSSHCRTQDSGVHCKQIGVSPSHIRTRYKISDVGWSLESLKMKQCLSFLDSTSTNSDIMVSN